MIVILAIIGDWPLFFFSSLLPIAAMYTTKDYHTYVSTIKIHS